MEFKQLYQKNRKTILTGTIIFILGIQLGFLIGLYYSVYVVTSVRNKSSIISPLGEQYK